MLYYCNVVFCSFIILHNGLERAMNMSTSIEFSEKTDVIDKQFEEVWFFLIVSYFEVSKMHRNLCKTDKEKMKMFMKNIDLHNEPSFMKAFNTFVAEINKLTYHPKMQKIWLEYEKDVISFSNLIYYIIIV